MIFDIALVVVIFINFAHCWHEMAKQGKELDDLSTKYFIANKYIRDLARDLESRIIFLEKHKQTQDKYNEWIESHPPIKPT